MNDNLTISRESLPGTSSSSGSNGSSPVKDAKKRNMQPFESLLAAIGNKASGKLDVKGAVLVGKWQLTMYWNQREP